MKEIQKLNYFYENEYKPVSIEDVSFPQNKRNLIVIYLEFHCDIKGNTFFTFFFFHL